MENRVLVKDCHIIEYADALEMQREFFNRLLDDKSNGTANGQNVLLLCEHPHVYTLGRNGEVHNLLISEELLKKINATFFKVDRGGDITYHGYGQLVGYPILNLELFNPSLKNYIYTLEQTIINTIAQYGITGERLAGATGVWLESTTPRARKIAAIGVKASRYVTMHGFALNVNTDLNYFNYINPCGFIDKGVTSIAKELGHDVDFEELKKVLKNSFEHLFL